MTTVHAAFAVDVPGTIEAWMLALPAATVAAESSLRLTLDGQPLDYRIEQGVHGTQIVRFTAGAGVLACEISATITGAADGAVLPDDTDYLASSQYVPVEDLRDFASERFGGATGFAAVDAVRTWVARSIAYDMYRSDIDDDAAATLRKAGGMCRDFAHVVIGLCRAVGIPARYVAVYAPNLQPPDFHAVAEVWVDGSWWIIDATGLAPRASMVRIATGVDAGATAWLTNTGAIVSLRTLTVAAHSDIAPAHDTVAERVSIP